MDKFELDIFLLEISKQCNFAIFSIQNINELLASLQSGSTNKIWFYVQSFLVSTANVSKLLWGSKDTEHIRQPIRDSLEIEVDTFKEIRKLRNDFEHFDERLQKWAETSKNRNFIDSNIGPSNMIIGFDKSDYLRNYDTSTAAVTFKGKEYSLQPVVDELIALQQKIDLIQSIPHWER